MSSTIETVPLTQEDIGFIKRRAGRVGKAAIFFIAAFAVAGVAWMLGSGYHEPLYLAGGAILITLAIRIAVAGRIRKELKENRKLIYRGIVKKSMTQWGKNRENTSYEVYIDGNLIQGIDLYSAFSDGDEVEVHLSGVRKKILFKKILSGTGNVEYKPKEELPPEYRTEGPLTEEELSALHASRSRMQMAYLACLLIVAVAVIALEWLFAYWDVQRSDEKWVMRAGLWIPLAAFALIWYLAGIWRVSKDLRSGAKVIIETHIIDKENIYYKGTTDYRLKTPSRTVNVSRAGYTLFENREAVEVHLTGYRKKLIRIDSREDTGKSYRSEKFFHIK